MLNTVLSTKKTKFAGLRTRSPRKAVEFINVATQIVQITESDTREIRIGVMLRPLGKEM